MYYRFIFAVLYFGVATAVRPLPHDGNFHFFFSKLFSSVFLFAFFYFNILYQMVG